MPLSSSVQVPSRPRTHRAWLAAPVLGGALALGSWPSLARACKPVPPYWYTNPWNLTDADDDSPPSAAPVVSVEVGEYYDADQGCGHTDCPSAAPIRLFIEEAAPDDRTDPSSMAYRVEAVSGDSPFPDQPLLPEAQRDGTSVIELSARARSLDLRVRLIPVDAGGNEGPPSNEVVVRYNADGCSTFSTSPANLTPLALVLGVLAWRARQRRRRASQA